MFNIYYKNRAWQKNLKPLLLHKLKAGLRSLSTLVIITSSCAAIANDTDNDMRSGSKSTLEVINVIGSKVTSISESASRLGLSLKETPATIDIISGDAIRIRNDVSLINAVTRSAGFSGAANPGNGGTSISARGFTGQDAVTKLYDGNRYFTLAGTLTFPFDTWAVERVEILKGPASVLYGLGGIAGAYNVIPKSPSEEFESHIRLSVGENNTQFLGASVNGALSESLVGRADISASKSDNWVSNGASESEMMALALKWQASDNLALTIRHDAGEQSPLRYFGIPLVDGDFNKDWIGLNFNVEDSRINYDDRITRLIADWNISDSVSLNTELFSLNTDRYWQTVETYSTNSDNSLITRADPLIIRHELKQQGMRGNLVFNSNIGDVGWKSSVGFELTDVRMKYTSNFNSSHPNSVDWGGDTDLVDPTNFSAGSWSDLTDSVAALDQVSDVSQAALFAETQLRFTDKFALVSGLRYDIIKTDYERLTYNEFGVRDTDVDNSVNQKVAPLMLRLGFVYDLNEETALYGQVSTGDTHQNGGDIVRVKNSLREADTVTVKQTEVGIKQSLIEDRLVWNLAIFNIARNNMLIDDPDNSDPTVFTLVPKQTAQGIEVGLDYILNESLIMYMNAAMVDSERDTGSEITPTPYSPDITFNAGLLYNITERLRFGADLRYVDERPYKNTPLPSYTVWDLSLGYSINESARLTVNAKNIGDELYATSDHWAGGQWSVGEPRTLSLTLDLNF
jgi:iron complex outermembrane receptor protein